MYICFAKSVLTSTCVVYALARVYWLTVATSLLVLCKQVSTSLNDDDRAQHCCPFLTNYCVQISQLLCYFAVGVVL